MTDEVKETQEQEELISWEQILGLVTLIQKWEMEAAVAQLVKNPPQMVKHCQPNGIPLSRHERNMWFTLLEFLKMQMSVRSHNAYIDALIRDNLMMKAVMEKAGLTPEILEESPVIETPDNRPYAKGAPMLVVPGRGL